MKIVRAAMKAVIMKDDKFLIIKQILQNKIVWDLPGGKVEHGETPFETLKREVIEEVYLSVNIVKSLGVFWFFAKNEQQVICTTFLCTLSGDDDVDISKNPADENISEFKWVTKDEFITDIYSVGDESLKDLIRTQLK